MSDKSKVFAIELTWNDPDYIAYAHTGGVSISGYGTSIKESLMSFVENYDKTVQEGAEIFLGIRKPKKGYDKLGNLVRP